MEENELIPVDNNNADVYKRQGEEWRGTSSYQNLQGMVTPRPRCTGLCCRTALCTLSVYDLSLIHI